MRKHACFGEIPIKDARTYTLSFIMFKCKTKDKLMNNYWNSVTNKVSITNNMFVPAISKIQHKSMDFSLLLFFREVCL